MFQDYIITDLPPNKDKERIIFQSILIHLPINSVKGEEQTVGGEWDGAGEDKVIISQAGDLVGDHRSLWQYKQWEQ